MKNLLLAVTAVLVIVAMVAPASAQQHKMSLSVGPDVLIPMGDFGTAFSTGFGGTVRFQYDMNAMAAVGAETGYFTWGGKDITSGGVTATGPGFHGIPFRVFGKYYFMPSGGTRVYGLAAIGLFFGSTGDVTVNVPGFGSYTVSGASSTGFNWVPEVGVEFPMQGGKNAVDVSVRLEGISASGGTNTSIAFRAAYNFSIGS